MQGFIKRIALRFKHTAGLDEIIYFLIVAIAQIVLFLSLTIDMSENGDSANNGNTHNAEVVTVAVKLPQFWTSIPTGWFARAESQFRASRITREETKFDYVLGSLSEEVIHTVIDIIDNPGDTPYASLKKALIDRHTLSESKRIEELLSGAEMGDRRPSEFYRYLQTTAGSSDGISEQLITQLWMRRLPPMVQAVLKGNVKLETHTLLTMADNVFEVIQQQQRSVFSASSSRRPTIDQGDGDRFKRLEDEIGELKKMISRLTTGRRGRSKSRERSQSSAGQDMCWYHRKHGSKARKCNKPCSFSNNDSSN